MNQSNSCRWPWYLLALTLAVTLFSASGARAAETASPLAAMTALRAEIDTARAAHKSGEDVLDHFGRWQKLERRFGALADEAIAANTSDGDRLRALIETQLAALQDALRRLRTHTEAARDVASDADPEQRMEREFRLRDFDLLLARLQRDLLDTLERLQAVGFDTGSAYEDFDQGLTDRAQGLAERLELAASRLQGMRERQSLKGETGAGARDELAVLEQRNKRLAQALDASVALMRERGLDVSRHAQLLIRTTGTLSSDIFDSRVLGALLQDWLATMRKAIADNGPAWFFRGVLFLLILLVFRWLAKLAGRITARAVRSPTMNFSALLQDFFVTIATNAVMVLGFLIALAQLGVNVGPVLAGLGVAGFIVGFALQDTLSNFAAGLMILIYRPFDVSDVIEAGGVTGKVSVMNLVSTTVLTFDNQKLVVPNSKIWGDVIRNVNAQPTRRVDLVFGIGYDDDIAQAKGVLEEIVAGHELILDDPAPTIRLHTLGDSSVDFIVRPWVKAPDYWTVYWDLTSAVKQRFDAEGISIPYPQRDVHVYQETPARDDT